MAVKTYKVVAARGEKYWVLTVPEVPGVFSQARNLAEVEPMIRDALSLGLEVEPNSFGVDVDVALPSDELAELRNIRVARIEAARLQRETADRAKALVARLESEGLSRRDISEVLGVSQQRVSQLAA